MNTTNDTTTSDLENRLRTEFADRASRASGADRIRAALASQPLQIRARRTAPSIGRWVSAAAAVAVVVAGIPIGLHLANLGPRPGTVATTPPPAIRHDTAYELTYAPRWLPPGFHTTARTSSVGGAEQKSGWTGPTGSIDLSVWHIDTDLGQGELHQIQLATRDTTINGRHAAVFTETEFASVEWQPDQNTVIDVVASDLPNALTTAESVATSVAPTGPRDRPAVAAGLSFGPLPSGYQPYAQSAAGPRRSPTRVIAAGDAPPSAAVNDLTAQLTPPHGMTNLPGGQRTPVTVLGRSGSYVGGGAPTVGVQLADGSWLTVQSLPLSVPGRTTPPRLTKDELVAIANGITIDPAPDFSWLGQ